MTSYNFIIAKFVPDIVKNEPVNIGIIIHSPEEKTSYGRFIENFRPLSGKYHNFNVSLLKDVLEGFRGKYKVDSLNYLEELTNNFSYHLVFTQPSGIIAGTPEQALNKLYEEYISIEVKKIMHKALTRFQLRSWVKTKIIETEMTRWLAKNKEVEGKIGKPHFDFVFRNGKPEAVMHAISFGVKQENALKEAKALALSVEDVLKVHKDLDCAAILHAPPEETEEFGIAKEHLRDKGCSVKIQEKELEPFLRQVKKKLQN